MSLNFAAIGNNRQAFSLTERLFKTFNSTYQKQVDTLAV
ncbi:hypothetical protein VPMS16_304 [Vibrio sp. 16]|nr:hypothetical protein VPMS16_304 [Vibrio sp. 16]